MIPLNQPVRRNGGSSTVYRWVRQDRIDRGELAGTSTIDKAELRETRRRIAEVESELAVVKRASELFDEGRVVRPMRCSTSWRQRIPGRFSSPSRATDSGTDEGASDVPGELPAAAPTDAPSEGERRESVLRRMAEEAESTGLEY